MRQFCRRAWGQSSETALNSPKATQQSGFGAVVPKLLPAFHKSRGRVYPRGALPWAGGVPLYTKAIGGLSLRVTCGRPHARTGRLCPLFQAGETWGPLGTAEPQGASARGAGREKEGELRLGPAPGRTVTQRSAALTTDSLATGLPCSGCPPVGPFNQPAESHSLPRI